jgi:hypothetical protein
MSSVYKKIITTINIIFVYYYINNGLYSIGKDKQTKGRKRGEKEGYNPEVRKEGKSREK